MAKLSQAGLRGSECCEKHLHSKKEGRVFWKEKAGRAFQTCVVCSWGEKPNRLTNSRLAERN